MNSFRIETKEEFFKILDCDEDTFTSAIKDKEKAYFKYKLQKKIGSRYIYGLVKDNLIYTLQKKINREIFKNILFPDCVYGFCKRRSYLDFLVSHISNNQRKHYLRLDISDFFDSIEIDDIYQCLSYYISNDISGDDRDYILQLIVDITTLNNHAIQGAITSPAISNIIFRSLDIRIEKYCEKIGVHYTRYADDMLFSSESSYIHSYKFTNAIQAIISDKGFYLNRKKTLKCENEISLNGYVVGTNIRLSRKKYKSINKIIYTLTTSSFTGFKNNYHQYITRNKLAGYRSFLIQYSRYIQDENQNKKIQKKIETIQNLILKYCVSSI